MIKSISHLEAALKIGREHIFKCIDDIKNNNSKAYYSYYKRKKSGRKRVINPSIHLTRRIQDRIQLNILCEIKMPHYVVGSQKGRNGVLNGKIHSGYKYHFQTDLSSFFDFITNKKVNQKFLDLGFSPKVSSILTKLTTNNGHLPQGAPTSPFIANIVGLEMDKDIVNLCDENNIVYTRYVDDLTFSSNKDFKHLVPNILNIILEHGYLYSHKKTLYKIGAINVTGVKSHSKGISPTKQQLDKFSSESLTPNSILGLKTYFEFVKKVNNGFRYSEYKSDNSDIQFPQKLIIK